MVRTTASVQTGSDSTDSGEAQTVEESNGAEDLTDDSGQDDDFQTGKIYCANCIQCKLFPLKEREDRYVLRIRCAAGKWKKKLGEEKLYKYSTITRRYVDVCEAYEAMGDAREFIRELRKTVSGKDEIYSGAE